MGVTEHTNQGAESLRRKAENNRMPEMYGINTVTQEERVQDLKDSVEKRYSSEEEEE